MRSRVDDIQRTVFLGYRIQAVAGFINSYSGRANFIFRPLFSQNDGIGVAQFVVADRVAKNPIVISAGSVQFLFIFAEGQTVPRFFDCFLIKQFFGIWVNQLDGLRALPVVGYGQ